MSEIKKTVEVPAHTETRVVGLKCDLCGAESGGRLGWGHGYDFDEVVIYRKYGTRYPECGNETEIRVDLCPKCFTTKLLPLLRDLGVTPLENEIDY